MKRFIIKLCVGAARAYSMLPMRFHYAVADAAYVVLYHLVRYRLRTVRDNVALAFPHADKAEQRQIVRRFYHRLCDQFAESAKGITMDIGELARRFRPLNIGLPQSYLAAGHSVLLYGAHMGNWEWFIALPSLFSRWASTQAFYQTQQSDVADAVTLSLRSRGGIVPVESKRAFIHTAHEMRAGRQTISLMLGDQRPRRLGRKIWTDFLGVETPFLAGPEMLAAKLGCVLIYPHVTQTSRGHYEVEFKLISDNPASEPAEECTRRYAALLEDNIREQPHLWLWSHRRWKWKKGDPEIRD